MSTRLRWTAVLLAAVTFATMGVAYAPPFVPDICGEENWPNLAVCEAYRNGQGHIENAFELVDEKCAELPGQCDAQGTIAYARENAGVQACESRSDRENFPLEEESLVSLGYHLAVLTFCYRRTIDTIYITSSNGSGSCHATYPFECRTEELYDFHDTACAYFGSRATFSLDGLDIRTSDITLSGCVPS